MKPFFFDTANVEYIKKTWSQISSKVDKKLVVGITTNPNAFFKLNKLSIKEWFDLTPKLCELVSEIRQDDKGVVYIQGPSSQMSPSEILRYAEKVVKLTDGNTKVGLKIGPFKEILEIVPRLNSMLETNVTGVADAATALKSASYKPKYVSIIPGRMEEVGIDAKSHISFVNQALLNDTRIIAGSMRTIEGLIWTFQYNTVPTIGERVWNLVLEDGGLDRLLNISYDNHAAINDYGPNNDERNTNLSISFFDQMDECGKKAYSEL